MSLGGIGAISVLSNIMPRQTVEITDKYFAGDVAGAAKLSQGQKQLLAIARVMVDLPPMLILDELMRTLLTVSKMKSMMS